MRFKKNNPPKFVILSGILIVIQFGCSQRIISCSVEIITIAQANVRLNSWLNNWKYINYIYLKVHQLYLSESISTISTWKCINYIYLNVTFINYIYLKVYPLHLPESISTMSTLKSTWKSRLSTIYTWKYNHCIYLKVYQIYLPESISTTSPWKYIKISTWKTEVYQLHLPERISTIST